MHHVRRDRYLNTQDLSSTRSIKAYFAEIKRRAIDIAGHDLCFTEPNSSHGGVGFSHGQTYFQTRAEGDGTGLYVFTFAEAPSPATLDPGLVALIELDPRAVLRGEDVERARPARRGTLWAYILPFVSSHH